MSDREVILRALQQVRRRLRLTRTLHDAATVFGMVAVGLLSWRVAHLFAGRPPIVAAAVLVALLLWVAGLCLLVRRRFAERSTLRAAADAADAGAGLRDELKTAYWFLEHPVPSPWISAQIARAAQSARRLEPAALVPLRFEQRALAGGVAIAGLVLAVWLVPPLAPRSGAAPLADALSGADARQVQLLRKLMAQSDDEAIAAALEQALKTLERKTATEAEKERALAAANQVIEQQNLQAASTREGLYKLSEKLRGSRALEEVAKALDEADAAKAAKLVQKMAESHGAANARESASAVQREKEKDLERLLKDAARGEDKAARREISSAAAKEAVDRLNQIAEQLEVQGRLKEAAQVLSQLQLAVAQRSLLSAGRFSQQAAQNATPSPDNRQTGMPAGTMYRSAAIAQEKKASQQQEGSKSGAALGDSQADPVLGRKVTPLAVQLKQEAVTGESQDDPEGAPKNWFYTESKEQKSLLDYQGVGARSGFALGQSTGPEGISIRHRQIVKDYFMREGSQR